LVYSALKQKDSSRTVIFLMQTGKKWCYFLEKVEKW